MPQVVRPEILWQSCFFLMRCHMDVYSILSPLLLGKTSGQFFICWCCFASSKIDRTALLMGNTWRSPTLRLLTKKDIVLRSKSISVHRNPKISPVRLPVTRHI